MATNRVLTDEERQVLLNSSSFTIKCQWAIRNHAAYWSIHDGANLNTEADRITWAKNRQLGVGYLVNGINDSRLNEYFLNASKGKQFNIDAAPLDETTLVNTWISNNSFEEFVQKYFDMKGLDIRF